MFQPIVNAGELLVENPEGSWAICTLWSPRANWKKLVPSNVPLDQVCVVGNLYNADGVDNIFRNLVANPQIRTLLVVGEQFKYQLTKEIYDSFEHGRTLKVQGAEDMYIRLDHVTLAKESRDCAIASYPATVLSPLIPLILPAPKVSCSIGEELDRPGHVIHAATAQEGWEALKKLILTHGRNLPSRYGGMKEILGLTMVLDTFGPTEGWINLDVARPYALSLINGTDADTTYNYGERLNRGEGVKSIVGRCTGRHAYWPVWVESDVDNREPPCLTSVWFRERLGKLVGIWSVRSQDMYRGWPMNAYGCYYLQESLADRAGLEMGQFVMQTASAHIYERDWEHEPSLKQHYLQDPTGHFIISVESDRIRVDLMRDGAVVDRFEGASALTLQSKIQHLVNSVSHAMYLGRELQKAEDRLRGVLA